MAAGRLRRSHLQCPLHTGSVHRWSAERGFCGGEDRTADGHHETVSVPACRDTGHVRKAAAVLYRCVYAEMRDIREEMVVNTRVFSRGGDGHVCA